MPDNQNESPAVKAFQQDQAEQRKRASKSDLDQGLEDSFPASDPVSITNTAISSGRMDPEAADKVNRQADPYTIDQDFPLVDAALKSRKDRRNHGGGSGEARREELAALKADVGRLSESATGIASGSVRVAKAETKRLLHDFEERVRASPLTAVGIVAALAYVWGATR